MTARVLVLDRDLHDECANTIRSLATIGITATKKQNAMMRTTLNPEPSSLSPKPPTPQQLDGGNLGTPEVPKVAAATVLWCF